MLQIGKKNLIAFFVNSFFVRSIFMFLFNSKKLDSLFGARSDILSMIALALIGLNNKTELPPLKFFKIRLYIFLFFAKNINF